MRDELLLYLLELLVRELVLELLTRVLVDTLRALLVDAAVRLATAALFVEVFERALFVLTLRAAELARLFVVTIRSPDGVRVYEARSARLRLSELRYVELLVRLLPVATYLPPFIELRELTMPLDRSLWWLYL